MAAVTRVRHQFGTPKGTRSTPVTDMEVEEGHFLISQLGFDVETRLKGSAFGKSATASQLSTRDASWMRALRAAGHGHPSPKAAVGAWPAGPRHGSRSQRAEPQLETLGCVLS